MGAADPPAARPNWVGAEAEGELFCVCEQPWRGEAMLACDRCSGWFHPLCMDMSDNDTIDFLLLQPAVDGGAGARRWVCCGCAELEGTGGRQPAGAGHVRGRKRRKLLLRVPASYWEFAKQGQEGAAGARPEEEGAGDGGRTGAAQKGMVGCSAGGVDEGRRQASLSEYGPAFGRLAARADELRQAGPGFEGGNCCAASGGGKVAVAGHAAGVEAMAEGGAEKAAGRQWTRVGRPSRGTAEPAAAGTTASGSSAVASAACHDNGRRGGNTRPAAGAASDPSTKCEPSGGGAEPRGTQGRGVAKRSGLAALPFFGRGRAGSLGQAAFGRLPRRAPRPDPGPQEEQDEQQQQQLPPAALATDGAVATAGAAAAGGGFCALCQGPPVGPVTTPCGHSFCKGCLTAGFLSARRAKREVVTGGGGGGAAAVAAGAMMERCALPPLPPGGVPHGAEWARGPYPNTEHRPLYAQNMVTRTPE